MEVNDIDFDEKVLKSNVPIIIDFWAPWCSPCKAILPLIEEMAKDFKGHVYKMNVDNNQKIPAKFGVRGIPTLIRFENGEVKDILIGAVSKSKLKEFFNE